MSITVRSYESIMSRSQAIAGGPDLGSILGVANDPLEFCVMAFSSRGFLTYYSEKVTENLNFDQALEALGAKKVSDSVEESRWEYNGKVLNL